MPQPYSTDLRERALLACEQDEDSFTAVARRFRVGVSTLRLWREQARTGQRAPRRLGRGPAPPDGDLLLLNEIVVERNDATLAEYGEMLAARTGKPRRSAPALCRALKRLGWAQARLCPGCASKDAQGQRARPCGRGTGPPRLARRGRRGRAQAVRLPGRERPTGPAAPPPGQARGVDADRGQASTRA